MSREWASLCECGHEMNYHRNIGKDSCTYTGCPCGKFRDKSDKG